MKADRYEAAGLVHGDNEPHITEHYGTELIVPQIVAMVFRMKPGRNDETDEQKRHHSEVIVEWIDRWAVRRGLVYDHIEIAAIGGHTGEQPDALAASFVAIKVPPDWTCFSSLMFRAITQPQQMPTFVLGGMGFPDITDVSDLEEVVTEVGGRKHTIGGTKKSTVN